MQFILNNTSQKIKRNVLLKILGYIFAKSVEIEKKLKGWKN